MDFALQRKNMVESQVRPSDVTDRRVIAAMLEVPREAFVPDQMRSLAYMDGEISLLAAMPGRPARALMAPRVLARLVDMARLGTKDIVLDVGCATGYSSAILGKLAGAVVAIESDGELAAAASKRLAALSLDNVAVVEGPLPAGRPADGPYSAVVLEGSVGFVPEELLSQLKDGGRLVGVLREAGMSRAVCYTRRGAIFDRRFAFDAAAPALPGFERAREFSL